MVVLFSGFFDPPPPLWFCVVFGLTPPVEPHGFSSDPPPKKKNHRSGIFKQKFKILIVYEWTEKNVKKMPILMLIF